MWRLMSIQIYYILWHNYFNYRYQGDFMIKEKRKLMGYTQERMSKILGISLRQYVRIDNEEDLPRRDVLKNLIKELELSNEEIGEYIRKMTENIA